MLVKNHTSTEVKGLRRVMRVNELWDYEHLFIRYETEEIE